MIDDDDSQKVTEATFEKYKDVHEEALERFEEAKTAESEMRDAARDDIAFRRGDQWSKEDKRARRGRPTLTIPRINDFPRRVVNEARKNRPAINVSPADSAASAETATVINGLVRNIERISRADLAYDTALDQAVGNGFGHWQVITEYLDEDSFVQEPRIARIPNPFSVYSDPTATEPDWFDAKWRFLVEEVSANEFERVYGFKPTDVADLPQKHLGRSWFSRGGTMVQVAKYWRIVYDESTIYQTPDGAVLPSTGDKKRDRELFAQAGMQPTRERVVRKPRAEPYLMTGAGTFLKSEYKGAYIPIITVVGEELWDEDERTIKSLIRDAKDSQRAYNFWASLETELVAQQPKSPWVLGKGSIDDPELKKRWDAMNAKAFPYVEYDTMGGSMPAPFRSPPPTFPDAIRAGMMRAEDDMRAIMGMPQATQGMVSSEQSGVAVYQRKLQGDIGTFHFIDNLGRAIRNTGIVLVDLIPHLFDRERVARIVNADQSVQKVQINRPFIDPADGKEKNFDVRMGRYDVAVEAGPSYQSQREQQIDSMIKLAQAFPPLMQAGGDLVVAEMPWTNAKEIAQRLKAMLPPELTGGLPAQVKAQLDGLQQQLQGAGEQIKGMERYITEQQFDVQKKEMEARGREQMSAVAIAKLNLEREKLQVDTVNARASNVAERIQAAADLLTAQVEMVKAVGEAAGIAVDASNVIAMLQGTRTQIQGLSSALVQSTAGSDPLAAGQGMRTPHAGAF